MIRICVAGATGWVGRALVPAILAEGDFRLVGAVARRAKGQDIGAANGAAACGVKVAGSVDEALADSEADVLVDYTKPDAVKAHVLTAIARGVHVVVGTSGLAAEDFATIAAAAEERGVGVVAAGNFSLTAALMQHLVLVAAPHLPHAEIVDYAGAMKPDVPSGTARELAERLGAVRPSAIGVPVERLHGPKETRGAEVGGTRVHSLRLPGYVLSCEAIFGLPGERLTVRHDAGERADPYVAGTLLAVRRAPQVRGLVRGLDRLLFA